MQSSALLPISNLASPSHAQVPACFADYHSRTRGFDEMVDAQGCLRPHWVDLGTRLSQWTAADFEGRKQSMQRLLRDHGVTYNMFDDAAGTSRPWSLDVIPLLIPAAEWSFVSRGVAQRSRLLNLILEDFYGPQNLLACGLLPPALLFANPGFLRLGNVVPGTVFAPMIGFDLIRGMDGAWRVLADRTQVPAGIGYSLENRIISSDVLSGEFAALGVQRLAGFFEMEREAIRALSPLKRQTASVVMLTPGPMDPTYFEHAFKARYLGFPLVESADLTVRDRQVFLKTLEGLRRVDVILRRMEDVRCDPLEQRNRGNLGVPGLTEAWREGNVVLVNGMGSGVLESQALHAFMPRICEHLLGEPLLLQGVPTLWCGQPHDLARVLDAPDQWVLKRAFPEGNRRTLFTGTLDAAARAALLDEVRSDPHQWVAQEILTLSTAPTWMNGKLEPRSIVWRTFSAQSDGVQSVMPGGLSRVSHHAQEQVIAMQTGAISKDTWVLADGPVDTFSLLQDRGAVLRPARPPGGVPSRAADHLYWLGRYAERLEQTARVLRMIFRRFIGEGSELQTRELALCRDWISGLTLLPAELMKLETTEALLADLRELLSNPKREGSIPGLINLLRFNAAAARDRLSDDTWRLFNRLERDSNLPPGPLVITNALGVLDTLILDLAAFSGMQLENTTRGHGWRFLEIGRRMERSLAMLEYVKEAARIAVHDEAILMPLLEVADSTMTYRRLHFSRPSLLPVLDLLMLNETNPRSLNFQLLSLARQTSQLPQDASSTHAGKEKNLADLLLSKLSSLNLSSFSITEEHTGETIGRLCTDLSDDIETLSNHITEHYFSHAARRPA